MAWACGSAPLRIRSPLSARRGEGEHETVFALSLRVAITGGIACGKSLFSRCLERLGVEVLDTDDVAHGLLGPQGEAVDDVRRAFGDRVVASDGGIDRRALGELVFSDPEARRRLNALVHPRIRSAVERWLASGGGAKVKAVAVPLLFEAGWGEGWDVVVCVAASEAVQVQRLMRDRGLSESQARARVDAQMPVAEKAARSHLVVRNDAGAEALESEAERVFRVLMERSE